MGCLILSRVTERNESKERERVGEGGVQSGVSQLVILKRLTCYITSKVPACIAGSLMVFVVCICLEHLRALLSGSYQSL